MQVSGDQQIPDPWLVKFDQRLKEIASRPFLPAVFQQFPIMRLLLKGVFLDYKKPGWFSEIRDLLGDLAANVARPRPHANGTILTFCPDSTEVMERISKINTFNFKGKMVEVVNHVNRPPAPEVPGGIITICNLLDASLTEERRPEFLKNILTMFKLSEEDLVRSHDFPGYEWISPKSDLNGQIKIFLKRASLDLLYFQINGNLTLPFERLGVRFGSQLCPNCQCSGHNSDGCPLPTLSEEEQADFKKTFERVKERAASKRSLPPPSKKKVRMPLQKKKSPPSVGTKLSSSPVNKTPSAPKESSERASPSLVSPSSSSDSPSSSAEKENLTSSPRLSPSVSSSFDEEFPPLPSSPISSSQSLHEEKSLSTSPTSAPFPATFNALPKAEKMLHLSDILSRLETSKEAFVSIPPSLFDHQSIIGKTLRFPQLENTPHGIVECQIRETGSMKITFSQPKSNSKKSIRTSSSFHLFGDNAFSWEMKREEAILSCKSLLAGISDDDSQH